MKFCQYVARFVLAMSSIMMLIILGSVMDMELIHIILYLTACTVGIIGGWFFNNYWELQIRRRNRNSHKKIVAEVSQLDRDLIEFRRVI